MTAATVEEKENADWNESKQFKDPVYGYITLNRAYTKHLIDTQKMQRIKGVAQTGIRSVFSSATHDRFSHSLGVYKFGMDIYATLSKRLKVCFLKHFSDEVMVDKKLSHWKKLLAIACLLHDIGHPVQSHGFEFLYDDYYLDTRIDEKTCRIDRMQHDELERIFNAFMELPEFEEKKYPSNLSRALLKELGYNQQITSDQLPGSPHERMSAYYILTDKTLQSNIKKLLNNKVQDDISTDKEDIEFIVRMIIGWEYPAQERLSFDEINFLNSAKNCVIHILNGSIDADGMDYLMRNAYSAGYDTSKVDNARLCGAYTAYETNNKLFPAFSKSALSVLEGYITARNFEPTWLYSHHKVVYADLVTKRIYKFLLKYLADQELLLSSVRLFVKQANRSAIVWQPSIDEPVQSFGKELMLQMPTADNSPRVQLTADALHSHMLQMFYPLYTYLLAPCRHYQLGAHQFFQMTDADLEALIHCIRRELGNDGTNYDKEYEVYLQRVRSLSWTKVACELSDVKDPVKALRILCAETLLKKIQTVCSLPILFDLSQELEIIRKWIENNKRSGLSNLKRRMNDILSERAPDNMKQEIKKDLKCFCSLNQDNPVALLEYWLNHYDPLLSKDDYIAFKHLLDEYETRNFCSSMWKSYAEYQLFLTYCAKELFVSNETVHRYMMDLICEGMSERGFSIFDGSKAKNPPENYREQFYYLPVRATTPIPASPPEKKKDGLMYWARLLFCRVEGQYDFSYNNLVVKLYKMKTKQFKELDLLFGKKTVPLASVISVPKARVVQFPYIFYRSNSELNADPQHILECFRKRFIDYCKDMRSKEVRSVNIMSSNTHIFHDAVHGDIAMPDAFYALVRTSEFQRLGRIKQLATADRSFPGATHTRLSHSLGTWHVMRMILNHFTDQLKRYPHMQAPNEKQQNAALLAALLHDLGHGPYSHAFETVSKRHHESMTLRIIQDNKTEIHKAIINNFGQDTFDIMCQLLNPVQESSAWNNPDIHTIYKSLISSQLDADRIDYIMRDNNCCGMSYGHIDIAQIIASMRLLPQYEGQSVRYCLCFDDRYLAAIDQFIYARYQMYKNIYHDPQKMLHEKLFAVLFEQARALCGAIRDENVFSVIRQICDSTKEVSTQEYLSLDDEAINCLIREWAEGKVLKDDIPHENDTQIKGNILCNLAKAFLDYKNLYKQVDLGAEAQAYDLLAKRVSRLLGMSALSMKALNDKFISFQFIANNEYAYKRQVDQAKTKENILLRNAADGTIAEYSRRSAFKTLGDNTDQNSLWETEFRYLFFSPELFEEECKLKSLSSQVKRVIEEVEASEPRRHIEIERKYNCEKETLEAAISFIKYLSDTSGILKESSKSTKKQIDMYYDVIEGLYRLLYKHNYTLRCRQKDGTYIFTMKVPTASENYASEQQLARYEYEYRSSDDKIDENVFEFIRDTLRLPGKNDWAADISKENITPLMTIVNNRTTIRLSDISHKNPVCEICLDTIEYHSPSNNELIGEPRYQIEVELLAEPEYWLELEENLIKQLEKHLSGRLQLTSASKLTTGLEMLDNTVTAK